MIDSHVADGSRWTGRNFVEIKPTQGLIIPRSRIGGQKG
ncbi:hypothetical protein AA0112_g9415 [Alternaria arborescens]|jgi:hypothetical protein|nr:hypothetical protein AA0112_g9415 [Alternaria arborescens]